jgi:archaemetzincin
LEKQEILLVSHGLFEKEFLEQIANDLQSEFVLPVKIISNFVDLSPFFDPARRQYDGNKILKLLDSKYASTSLKTIGLFQVDLFIPILTFIFGQAIFKGKTGVVSLYRLKNEQYGLMKNENLLFERFRKVIIHELGHSFGLIHCSVPSCVMRSTTYVEDIDQKESGFCSKCRKELELLITDCV